MKHMSKKRRAQFKRTFRERYLRSARAFELWNSGLTLVEVGKELGVSGSRARQLYSQYIIFVNAISPISVPYGCKERYGDNSAYPDKEERYRAERRKAWLDRNTTPERNLEIWRDQ